MAEGIHGREPPKKRLKLEDAGSQSNSSLILTSLAAPISPPRRKRLEAATDDRDLEGLVDDGRLEAWVEDKQLISANSLRSSKQDGIPSMLPSPFKLTNIKDLPDASNVDTVTLKDLLGDPLISECWEFNYLHDLDFLMNSFDPDVRTLVKVHVIHGFWRDVDGAQLKAQASRYPNVKLQAAYMPEMYGTHHTKMIVLLRHDSQAQIIIHTANLIPRDWANMTQAVWRSPLLPIMPPGTPRLSSDPSMGSGHRFKIDFLNYLRAYDKKRSICKPLIEQLTKFDFSSIRGALVGSVPGRYSQASDGNTKWGWPALRHVLNSVPVQQGSRPEVIIQISSIATLGPSNQWLEKTFFKSLATSNSQTSSIPAFKIIFPTADEIRRSLDGYLSGFSIHTKINSPAQIKQFQYLKPLLHHWAGDGAKQVPATHKDVQDSGRKRAAPHIKTFVRYSSESKAEIDWALVTSANLSKQAWGEACNAAGEVRVCSYELGILIWPSLFGDGVKMVPVFKQDTPKLKGCVSDVKVLGFRMPYDLPLVKYAEGEEPWCASQPCSIPDWKGETWPLKM